MSDTITNASVIRTIISNKTLLTSVGTLLEEALANFGTLGLEKDAFFSKMVSKIRSGRKAMPLTVLPDLMALLTGDRPGHFIHQNDTSEVLHRIMRTPPMLVGDVFTNLRPAILPPMRATSAPKNHEQIRHHLWIAHLQGTMPKTINMIVQRTAQRMLSERQRGFIGIPIGPRFSFDNQQGAIDIETRDSDGLDCVMSFEKSEVVSYIGTVVASLFAIDGIKNSIFRKNERSFWSGNDHVVKLNLKSIINDVSRTNAIVGGIFSNETSPLNLAIEYGYLNFSETPMYTQYASSPMYNQFIHDALLAFYVIIVCAGAVEPEGTLLKYHIAPEPGMGVFSDGMGGEYTALLPETAAASVQKATKRKAPVNPGRRNQ